MRAQAIRKERINRVVVRGTSWVGDAVMTVPALRELRRVVPQAHITLATRAWAEGIFAGADYVDELLIEETPRKDFGAFLRQRRAWAAHRFDLAVLLQNSFHSALVAFAARVPYRLGYAADGRRPLLSHPVEVPAWRRTRHEVYAYLHLIAALERSLSGETEIDRREPAYALTVSPDRLDEARRFLRARGVSLERPLVALCPGSTNSRAKRWPAPYYAALADLLTREAGAEVIIIGSREEMEVSREVVAGARSPLHDLTGQTALSLTVSILGLVDLLVTNDTGPAHIAASLDRPTLVIFGPTDPVQTRPFSPSAEVLREPPDCAPCMLRDCPIDHRCLTALTPERVFARAFAHVRSRPVAETVR